jgi:hypothetical protein
MRQDTAYGYRIEPSEAPAPLELHVLARAYRDAWLALRLRPPAGTHPIGKLGIAIDFEEPATPPRR